MQSSDLNTVWMAFYQQLERRGVSLMRLAGLNEGAVARLVSQRVKATKISEPVLAFIMQNSKGNPLFCVELSSHLLDIKFIQASCPHSMGLSTLFLQLDEKRECVFSPTANPATLKVAPSLKGLVSQRVDALGEDVTLVRCPLSLLRCPFSLL